MAPNASSSSPARPPAASRRWRLRLRRGRQRHGDQCRRHADLRRLPDPDRPAHGRGTGRRAASALWRAAAVGDPVGRALADLAAAEIERCLAEGRTPILCGGSGLYLRTLMQGIAAIPDVAGRRARPGQCRMAGDGRRGLPRAARRAGSGDRRAAEARRSPAPCPRLGSLCRRPAGRSAPGRRAMASRRRWRFATVLLAPERGWLRDRIESRFDGMLTAGVLAEVRAVFDRAPDPALARPQGAWRARAVRPLPGRAVARRGAPHRHRPHPPICQTPDDVVPPPDDTRSGVDPRLIRIWSRLRNYWTNIRGLKLYVSC